MLLAYFKELFECEVGRIFSTLTTSRLSCLETLTFTSYYHVVYMQCICIVLWPHLVVSLSSYLSQASIVLKCLSGSIWFSAQRLASVYPSLCCKGIPVSLK